MTALATLLAQRIAMSGPIGLNEYMAECLMHPQHGYYATRDPLGAGGDFTTAPEVSQMFGELLGLALAQSWLDQGAPARIILAELGPGRGTLMSDILRATKGVDGFHAALELHLVEASPVLREVQAQTLQDYAPQWHDDIATLPELPLWLIANEFFDALPIRQFTREGSMWRETCVAERDGQLTLGRATPAPIGALSSRLADTGDGDIVEICPMLSPIVDRVSTQIASHGGTAIFIDYGDWRSLGDTFQAVQNHESVDPMAQPGAADLTAHVDFEAIGLAAKSASACPSAMTTQRDLLASLGIQARATALASAMDGTELDAHHKAFERLTSDAEMGTLFKAIAIAASPTLLPPGFTAGPNS